MPTRMQDEYSFIDKMFNEWWEKYGITMDCITRESLACAAMMFAANTIRKFKGVLPMALKPVNNEEIMKVLDQKTKVYGSGVKFAESIDLDVAHLNDIKSGNRSMNQKVATGLGYELRWVKTERTLDN